MSATVPLTDWNAAGLITIPIHVAWAHVEVSPVGGGEEGLGDRGPGKHCALAIASCTSPDLIFIAYIPGWDRSFRI